ncbi:MAG TPA: hypothetical protein VE988_01090 [Gemmataceae bacterium]|nr:hypothetical protein [Gemmataceae bacterium]
MPKRMIVKSGYGTLLVWLLSTLDVLSGLPLNAQVVVKGQARLESITITRQSWTALNGVEHHDSSMMLRFWFPDEPKVPAKHYLAKMSVFASVKDDTGLVLSTSDRLKKITSLDQEVNCDFSSAGAMEGPHLEIVLDAPSKQAKFIKAISGIVDVSPAKIEVVELSNIIELSGKSLDHPKLKHLGIRCQSVAVENGLTTVVLHMPKKSARLYDWHLMSGNDELQLFGSGQSPANDGVVLDKAFVGDKPKQYMLRLQILEPIATKRFTLELKEIKLP